MTVTVNDRMQTGYRYKLTEPIGANYHLEFRSELTPKEMLRLGVFCGKYMTDMRSFLRIGSLTQDSRGGARLLSQLFPCRR